MLVETRGDQAVVQPAQAGDVVVVRRLERVNLLVAVEVQQVDVFALAAVEDDVAFDRCAVDVLVPLLSDSEDAGSRTATTGQSS